MFQKRKQIWLSSIVIEMRKTHYFVNFRNQHLGFYKASRPISVSFGLFSVSHSSLYFWGEIKVKWSLAVDKPRQRFLSHHRVLDGIKMTELRNKTACKTFSFPSAWRMHFLLLNGLEFLREGKTPMYPSPDYLDQSDCHLFRIDPSNMHNNKEKTLKTWE